MPGRIACNFSNISAPLKDSIALFVVLHKHIRGMGS